MVYNSAHISYVITLGLVANAKYLLCWYDDPMKHNLYTNSSM